MSGDMATDGHDSDKRGKTDHLATYVRFMAITKWAVIFIASALVVLALFLA